MNHERRRTLASLAGTVISTATLAQSSSSARPPGKAANSAGSSSDRPLSGNVTADDGVRLYYEETGSGDPVVFVHEFAGDHRSWEPQVRFLSRSFRCITFNARGYPPSEFLRIRQNIHKHGPETTFAICSSTCGSITHISSGFRWAASRRCTSVLHTHLGRDPF